MYLQNLCSVKFMFYLSEEKTLSFYVKRFKASRHLSANPKISNLKIDRHCFLPTTLTALKMDENKRSEEYAISFPEGPCIATGGLVITTKLRDKVDIGRRYQENLV